MGAQVPVRLRQAGRALLQAKNVIKALGVAPPVVMAKKKKVNIATTGTQNLVTVVQRTARKLNQVTNVFIQAKHASKLKPRKPVIISDTVEMAI